MFKKLIYICLLICLLACLGGAVFVAWGWFYITRDLPNLSRIEDYQPPAVTSIYAKDGTLIAEFYKERRYPVRFSEIPPKLSQAFIAAEDANFYKHPGIDLMSILRAFYKNLIAGGFKQGGSTITQQVVKNLLLSDEKKVRRKLKEAILSYRLEQRFTKDEILEMYLNQIFFGNTAYGIKAAALLYFHKDLNDVTVAEAAMLAGLPKAPSKYSPLLHYGRAKKRQVYVLNQMLHAGFISPEEHSLAMSEEVKAYPATANNIRHAPYYVSEVRRQFGESWLGTNIDTAGLKIYTEVDLSADQYANLALKRGLREVDKRRGWRGPIASIKSKSAFEEFQRTYSGYFGRELESDAVYPALVTEVSPKQGLVKVLVGNQTGALNIGAATWARRFLNSKEEVSGINPLDRIRIGDVIEVVLKPIEGSKRAPSTLEFLLDQTPEIEGALVLLDPNTGRVVAMVGGYSYQKSVFNRVTQSLRQPGSTFKPIVYLSAVDGFKYTPATIVYDTPRTFRVGDEVWTPGNFDEKYLGAITLRTALEKSRNLVSVDIVQKIGIDAPIQYAKKLGITSKLGRNLSLSLGSSEVTLLELSRAYGVFAARGVLWNSYIVGKVESRNGEVLYDYETERLNSAKQVISEQSAFIMASMMKGVVERGTATRVKALGRPVAGKTGTSNDEMDAWFIGYTPQWTCGVWVGFDIKKSIGNKETGGRVAAPIFLNFMDKFLKDQDQINQEKIKQEAKQEAESLGIEYVEPEAIPPLDFQVPDGVDPFWVDKDTGRLSEAGNSNAIYEYFVRGTEPQTIQEESDITNYLESPEL